MSRSRCFLEMRSPKKVLKSNLCRTLAEHLVMPYSHLLRASMSIFTDKGSTEATHHVSRFTYFFLIGSRVFVFCVGGRLLFFYLVLLFQLQNH